MIDLTVPAGGSVLVITHPDGSTTVSIPESVFHEVAARLAPMRPTNQHDDEPSCVYPVDDGEG
jgi:hypothetical protein